MIINIDSELEDRDKSSREIQRIFSDYQTKSQERLYQAIDELQHEILNRCSYLASISVELQRLITEIDTKITFIKSLYSNTDNATFIALTNVFNDYMRKDVIHNLEMMININIEGITQNIFRVEKRDSL
jgi:hypothetical protein